MAIIPLRKRRTHRPVQMPIVGQVRQLSPSIPTVVPSLQNIIQMMKLLGLRKVEIRPDDSVGFDYCHDY